MVCLSKWFRSQSRNIRKDILSFIFIARTEFKSHPLNNAALDKFLELLEEEHFQAKIENKESD